jgi:hypothetical protein
VTSVETVLIGDAAVNVGNLSKIGSASTKPVQLAQLVTNCTNIHQCRFARWFLQKIKVANQIEQCATPASYVS